MSLRIPLLISGGSRRGKYMAIKRMFDKTIIETDQFLNVSLTAKALYFLLGMEADDEGFISPNRILRLYGGEYGDIKNLIDAGLLIPFKSGVVVITHWNENNWLDSRRIKPTQYQDEKKLLLLTDKKRYELSTGGASIEERSIEEYRIEEKRGDVATATTPAQICSNFFEGGDVHNQLLEEFTKGNDPAWVQKEFQKFSLYWTEPTRSGKKQRWETEKTFEVKRRLYTWLSKSKDFKSIQNNKYSAGRV